MKHDKAASQESGKLGMHTTKHTHVCRSEVSDEVTEQRLPRQPLLASRDQWVMLGFSCCVASPHVGRGLGEGLARRLPRGFLTTCRTSHLALQPRLEPAASALSCSPRPPAATRAWQGLGATSTTGPSTSPWRMGAGMGNAPSQAFGIASSSPRLLLVLITTASCTNYCFLQFCLIMA